MRCICTADAGMLIVYTASYQVSNQYSGSCGYGALSSSGWPAGGLASISPRSALFQDSAAPKAGCGRCLEITCAPGVRLSRTALRFKKGGRMLCSKSCLRFTLGGRHSRRALRKHLRQKPETRKFTKRTSCYITLSPLAFQSVALSSDCFPYDLCRVFH